MSSKLFVCCLAAKVAIYSPPHIPNGSFEPKLVLLVSAILGYCEEFVWLGWWLCWYGNVNFIAVSMGQISLAFS